jgi:undecaprenyl diphosphate synthase
VDAVRAYVDDGHDLAGLNEDSLPKYLYTAGLPDPDLLIRTGGDKRISNFLLWQAAYAELYFCDAFWPDFGPEELDAALAEFARRARRFGR